MLSGGNWGYKPDMSFPRDILRFVYWIFFKPFSLHTWIRQVGPGAGNVATLLTRPHGRLARPLVRLALFYILAAPWLLAIGTGMLLSQAGATVNWLKLVFYLLVGIVLSLSFGISFCIAFLLPFSVSIAIWSSTAFTPALGVFFSLLLGLAYGLNGNSARWGLVAGLVYGIVIGLVIDPLGGLVIGAAFLAGYFRVIFYVIEAPLSWILGIRAARGNAVKLWRLQPVCWDEMVWFPLPGLGRHLRALKQQDEPAYEEAVRYVRESFRQGRWVIL